MNPLSCSVDSATAHRTYVTSSEPVVAFPSSQERRRKTPNAQRALASGHALQLAQLLSSRICHDLIGPIGIAAATDDLRNADNRIDEEAVELVAESARTAAARLAFFRFAFGFGQGSTGVVSGAELASLASAALSNSRLRVQWRQGGEGADGSMGGMPMPLARLILCLALMAAETLPRGGTLSVDFASARDLFTVIFRATGHGARPLTPALETFRTAESCKDLTPRTVIGFYAGEIARELGARIEMNAEPGASIEWSLCLSAAARSSADA